MDPLSIIAGSLAVVGAAGKSLQGLEKAWELQHRDQEFVNLWNQMVCLRMPLWSMEISLRQWRASPMDTGLIKDCAENINSLCDQAIRIFGDLNVLLHEMSPEARSSRTKANSKPSKRQWIRNKKKLVYMTAQVTNLSTSLTSALVVLQGVQQSIHTGRLESRVGAILNNITAPTHTEPIENLQEFLVSSGSSHEPLKSPVSPNGDNNIQTCSRRSSVATFHTAGSRPGSPVTVLSVIPEPPSEACKRICTCQCHTITRIQPPQWTKRFFGTVAFYGNRSLLLNRRACDKPHCRRTGSAHIQISYASPTWTPRSFNVYVLAESMRGVCIRMPREIPSNSIVWSLVELGKVTELRHMLARGLASPFDVDSVGNSLLKYAALKHQDESYACLLSENSDPQFRDQSGIMALQPGLDRALCSKTTWSSSYQLFVNTESIEQQDFSLLHLIVLDLKYLDLTTALECCSKEIDRTDINGRTALSWAARKDNLRAVELLLKCGADVNKSDLENLTPLAYASQASNSLCARMLLTAGANVSTPNKFGRQPIHLASESRQSTEVVKELVHWGADTNAKTLRGITPLHSAAKMGNMETIDFLLSNGGELNAPDAYGVTPVMNALLLWNESNFMYLAYVGARLNIVGQHRTDNTLHYVTWCGSSMAMQVITEAAERGEMNGVDPSALHEGHDIINCFLTCRKIWFIGHREPDEWTTFLRMIRAVGIDDIQ